MRAARFLGDGRIRLEERATPRPGPGELLVRVHWNALCGSDRQAYARGSAITPGHEIAGTVSALGDGVAGPPPGSPGVVYLVAFCGACGACRAGATNVCLDRRAMYGFSADGGLAEFVCVRADCFLRVEGLTLDLATALLDLFGTTLHALRRGGGEPLGSVGVIGCGPVGLGAIAVARHLGARSLQAVDVSATRLALAASAGAVVIDARREDVVATLRDGSGGGCDVVVEAAGLHLTQRQAIEAAAPGGRIVIVAHSRQPLELAPSHDLIARELSLVGSEYFPIGQHTDTLALVRDGLDPAPLITHRYPLEQVEQAYARFFAGETGKVLVQP